MKRLSLFFFLFFFLNQQDFISIRGMIHAHTYLSLSSPAQVPKYMQIDSIIRATTQRWNGKSDLNMHTLRIAFFLLQPTPSLSVFGRLITALFITVVFGNFSVHFSLLRKKSDGREPSGMTTLTAVTLTKIPPASHVTWAVNPQVTLYRGRGTLYTCDIKGSVRAFSNFWLRIGSDSVM